MRKRSVCAIAAATLLACTSEQPSIHVSSEPTSAQSIQSFAVRDGVQVPTQPTQPMAELRPVAPTMVAEFREPPPLEVTSTSSIEPSGALSIGQVRSVRVGLDLIGAGAPQAVVIEFISPSGMVYERRESALVKSAFDRQQLAFELPVAGTLIDTADMAGTWKAEARIDGALVDSLQFELTP
jgi:hypothetical protein